MVKNSFALRVLVISFLLLALPLLVDTFIFFQSSYDDSIADAKRNLREVSNLRAFALTASQPIKQVFLTELTYLLNLSESLDNPDQLQSNQELAEIMHVSGQLQIYVMTLEKNGEFRIVASSVKTLVNTFFTSFKQLEETMRTGTGTFVRHVYSHDMQRYVPYLFVARSIRSKKAGAPIGVIMVTSNVENQLNAILERGNLLENIQFAIVDSDGIVFASSEPRLEGQYFDSLSKLRREEIIDSGQLGEEHLPDKPLPVIKGNDPPFFEFIFDDEVQIAYRAYLPEVNISLVGYASKGEFFGAAITHFLLIYTIYGLILIIGGAVTYWLSLWISRPLRQLSHLMGEVSQGNLEPRFKEQPLGFEINILGRIFNHTIDNLLQNMQQAEDERVKKETYQRELLIGRQVQRSLLPARIPGIKGAKIAGTYIPASDVGGDFYGYLDKQTASGEEVVVISVADVAGRGISSCLYSLSARSLFSSFATLSDDVGEILSLANNAFIEDVGDTGMFLTVFMGMYHTESKIFSYYSCGHVPGLVRRADGQIITLAHSGMALGLKESNRYSPDSIQLESGDCVILYTDGLIEAVNDKYQRFSEKRLKQILQTKQWSTAQEVIETITTEVHEFIHSMPQEEEVIIVALKLD